MFEAAIAGSLPKPGWLAETNKLWPKWMAEGDALRQAKADATLLWIKAQEDAGLEVIGDGEQARQHGRDFGVVVRSDGIELAHHALYWLVRLQKGVAPGVRGPAIDRRL